MGYTNYWYQTRSFTNDEWVKIVDYFNSNLKNENVDLGAIIKSKPILFVPYEDEEIFFSGANGKTCESFCLSKTPTNEFNFCKTQQLPYDQVVWGLLKYIKEEVVGLNKSEFRIVNDNGEEIV